MIALWRSSMLIIHRIFTLGSNQNFGDSLVVLKPRPEARFLIKADRYLNAG